MTLVHCETEMTHLWGKTDFRCPDCSQVIEVYGDYAIDGYTLEEVSVVRLSSKAPRRASAVKELSLNDKRRAVKEAGLYGVRVTARNFGIPYSTLRRIMQSDLGLIGNGRAHAVQYADSTA